jgi:hypothetical protein
MHLFSARTLTDSTSERLLVSAIDSMGGTLLVRCPPTLRYVKDAIPEYLRTTVAAYRRKQKAG